MQISDGSGSISPASGVDFLQVREPGWSVRELDVQVRRLVSMNGPRVLVNDRADVAIACGAAGVHLRSGAVAVEKIRRIAPVGFVVTFACHDAEAVMRAGNEGADYAVLAPVFAPLSKPLDRPPLGLDALQAIVAKSTIPVIALGGITVENARLCAEVGAAGVAGITLFRRLVGE